MKTRLFRSVSSSRSRSAIASGNPPYTLTLNDEQDYYTVSFDTTTAETDLVITAGGRMLFIGLTAE